MSSSSSISDPSSSSSSLVLFLAELRDKKYSTLPFDERSRLLSALLPALFQILVSPNGKAATSIMMSSSAAANSSGGGGGTKEGRKGGGGGGAKRPRKKKDATKTSPMVEKETAANTAAATFTTTTTSTNTTNTPAAAAAAVLESDMKSPVSSTNNPMIKSMPTTTTTESKKVIHQQGLSPSTTTVIITPLCHVPPCHSITAQPKVASAAAVNHTIRHTALQLLVQLTLQLLLSTPTSSSASASSEFHSSTMISSNLNPTTNFFQGSANLTGDATLFRTHAPIITSIAIHVIMEDCEENALLANNQLLVRILRRYNKTRRAMSAEEGSSIVVNSSNSSSSMVGSSSGSNNISRSSTVIGGGGTRGGGKEGAKMLRECQALLDFIVDCYERMGKDSDVSVGGSGGTTSKKRKGQGGGGMYTNETTSKVLKLTTMAAATAKTQLSTEGGVVETTPVNKDMISSNIDLSTAPPSATTTTAAAAIGNENDKNIIRSNNAILTSPLPQNDCWSDIQSYQSFRLLSELPLTIMLLFQLYPIKLACKVNMSNLISAMMAFLQNQTLLTSSLVLSKTSQGDGLTNTPSAVESAMTPSLSTPLTVVASSISGKESSTSLKNSQVVEASDTQVAGNGKLMILRQRLLCDMPALLSSAIYDPH